MPVPTWTVQPSPPPLGAQQGDVWLNSTSGLLHIHNGSQFVRASTGDANGNTVAGTQAALNPSLATSGFQYIPVVNGSVGTPTAGAASYTGQARMAFDPVAARLWLEASGGNWKSIAAT